MQLQLHMATADESVAEFVESLPPGEGTIGCLVVWYAYEQRTDSPMPFLEFEAECEALGRTIDIYGRRHITGVDQRGTMEWFREQF